MIKEREIKEEHICCDGECHHDDCCGKVSENCPKKEIKEEKKMKLYKIRMECTSFYDVVVEAENEQDAKEQAQSRCQCPQNGMEFGEFLEVEEGDKPEF